MKIQPIATNHIHIHLDNGEILDINDGTLVPSGGFLNIMLVRPTNKYLVVKSNTSEIIQIAIRQD